MIHDNRIHGSEDEAYERDSDGAPDLLLHDHDDCERTATGILDLALALCKSVHPCGLERRRAVT